MFTWYLACNEKEDEADEELTWSASELCEWVDGGWLSVEKAARFEFELEAGDEDEEGAGSEEEAEIETDEEDEEEEDDEDNELDDRSLEECV